MSVGYSESDTWSALVDIGKTHPPLSEEEEKQMTDAYFETDHKKWAEIMVLHNMRFAIAQSDRYFVRGEDRVDILGRLIGGLEEAADRYKPEKGVRFLTFAGYYMKNAMRDVVDANRPAVKANNATMAILDKRVAGKKTDESAATVGDFVGNFQSPDYETVDPGSECRRDFERIEFENLVDHICSILREIPVYGTTGYDPSQTNGLKLTRSGLSRMVRLFRLRFLDMLSLDAIALQENCDRSTIAATINKALDYLRAEIAQNHGSIAELKDFFSRKGLDTVIRSEKAVDASESQFSPDAILSAKADMRVLARIDEPKDTEEETAYAIEQQDKSPIQGESDRKKQPKAKLIIRDHGLSYRIAHDSEDAGAGYTASMFARDQRESETASLGSRVDQTKTVYRDSGFFDADDPVQDHRYFDRADVDRNTVKPGAGFDVDRARAISNDVARSLYGDRGENSGHDVTPNYDRILIQRSRRRKLTIRCYPFYGNFYSEWRRWQEMKRTRRLIYGARLLALLESGVVRKEQCFRLRDGDLACYV